jgi:hypothetical protein
MTGMDDSQLSPLALAVAVQLTIDQHQERADRTFDPGTCRQCSPQLAWAERTLADLRARKPA